MTIKLGTRRSKLAVTQSQTVADLIEQAAGEDVELVPIISEGDDVTVPLDAHPRPGAFAATLRDALLASRVDVAVHSFKDLPSAPEPGLRIAAVPGRVEPRDALCSPVGLKLAELPEGAKVGTSSPRRAKGLLRVRPDLQIVPIRGNVDTRLRKAAEGEVDAVILAAAGLIRIGREAAITEYLDSFLPAPAQGALAVECRAEDHEKFAAINDEQVELTVTAERAVLAAIQAECTTAIGAFADWDGDQLRLRAELSDYRGVEFAQIEQTAVINNRKDAENLGLAVGAELLK